MKSQLWLLIYCPLLLLVATSCSQSSPETEAVNTVPEKQERYAQMKPGLGIAEIDRVWGVAGEVVSTVVVSDSQQRAMEESSRISQVHWKLADGSIILGIIKDGQLTSKGHYGVDYRPIETNCDWCGKKLETLLKPGHSCLIPYHLDEKTQEVCRRSNRTKANAFSNDPLIYSPTEGNNETQLKNNLSKFLDQNKK